jgi:hypothetical protein
MNHQEILQHNLKQAAQYNLPNHYSEQYVQSVHKQGYQGNDMRYTSRPQQVEDKKMYREVTRGKKQIVEPVSDDEEDDHLGDEEYEDVRNLSLESKNKNTKQRANHDDDDYATQGDLDADSELANEYNSELGSHQFMPKSFLGMKTATLGFHIVGQESPFMVLKNKLIQEAASLKVEDRMQGVRYLCSIPYNNGTYHCVEAAMNVICDSSIDVYKRFYFFDSKDKYFRLEDNVVYYCHAGFFKTGMKMGPIAYPYDLMLLSAKYIFQNYGPDTQTRQSCLDWILDIIENPQEDTVTKLKMIDFLMTEGQQDEQNFAQDQLYILGVEDINHVEFVAGDEQARDILRYLRTKYTVEKNETPEALFVACCKSQHLDANNQEEQLEIISEFFSNVISDNLKFEGILLADICVLIWKEIESLKQSKQNNSFVIQEIIRRFIDVALGYESDAEGDVVVDIINTLENFVTPRPFSLGPSLIERLRNDLFAALQQQVSRLNTGLRQSVEEARTSEDKSAAKEFLVVCFEDTKYNLEKSYEVQHQMNNKQFNDIYDQVIKEWLG